MSEKDRLERAEPPSEQGQTVPAEGGDAAGTEERPKGLYLTPRQAFIALAVALVIALIVLIVILLLSVRSNTLIRRGGDVAAGIRPIFTIDGPGAPPKPTFSRPLGVAFAEDGTIYVSDTGNNRICRFDSNGRFLGAWGSFGVAKPAPGGTYSWAPGRLNFPAGVAVDRENGDVYVADFRNDCVEVFDRGGKFLRRFPDPTKPVGRGGSGQDGKGIAVTSVAVNGDRVYATDSYQVFIFTRQGQLLSQFGKPGRDKGDLDHPNGIAVGKDGVIYVSDSNHARVTAFSSNGVVKWNLGSAPASANDTRTSDFNLPRGIAVRPDGALLVVDTFGFDLVKVSPNGELLGRYGERGVRPGQFNFPNAISVLGSRIAVADKENNRIQVVELVGQ
jgi:DNA-binding beta-propeller fold protein YncE